MQSLQEENYTFMRTIGLHGENFVKSILLTMRLYRKNI